MSISNVPERRIQLHLRLLKNVILNLLLVTSVLEHLCKTLHTAHTTTDARTNLRRVHILVQLVRIGDTGHVESFGSADQCPQRDTVRLGNNVLRDTVATGTPTTRDLSSDETTELERLGDEDASSLLELDEPLATFRSPDVALVAVLVLELLSLNFRRFKGLQIVNELNLLMEDLLLRVVSAEQFGLCRYWH